MKLGGAPALLIFLLITCIIVLWRYHMQQSKIWAENQLTDTRAMIAASERNTSAIVNLTEMLKTSAASNSTYQTEMRSRVYGELNELQKFRGEMNARWEEI